MYYFFILQYDLLHAIIFPSVYLGCSRKIGRAALPDIVHEGDGSNERDEMTAEKGLSRVKVKRDCFDFVFFNKLSTGVFLLTTPVSRSICVI